jgi:hypothetical protein
MSGQCRHCLQGLARVLPTLRTRRAWTSTTSFRSPSPGRSTAATCVGESLTSDKRARRAGTVLSGQTAAPEQTSGSDGPRGRGSHPPARRRRSTGSPAAPLRHDGNLGVWPAAEDLQCAPQVPLQGMNHALLARLGSAKVRHKPSQAGPEAKSKASCPARGTGFFFAEAHRPRAWRAGVPACCDPAATGGGLWRSPNHKSQDKGGARLFGQNPAQLGFSGTTGRISRR